MKRRALVTIAACIVAGAAVNVLIAWACAKWSPPVDPTSIVHEQNVPWPRQPPQNWPQSCDVERWRTVGLSGVHASKSVSDWSRPGSFPRGEDYASIIVQAGWPARSMEASFGLVMSSSLSISRSPARPEWLSGVRRGVNYLAWHAPPTAGKRRGLPLMPLPAGFAINTAFYSAITALMWLTSARTRVLIRRRRGLCPRCAYPLGISLRCTECGAPL